MVLSRRVVSDHPGFQEVEKETHERTEKLLSVGGSRTVDSFHRELGLICWEYCGMSRDEAGLKKALQKIPPLREQFWKDVKVLGGKEELNQSLEKAGRVADFFELAELMCHDALDRGESCGTHYRLESVTPEGEALRNDHDYTYVAAWEFNGTGKPPTLHKEPLAFENVELTQRSYK